MTGDVVHNIEQLNTDCVCVTLDIVALREAAEGVVNDPAFFRELAESHTHLFAAQPLFLSPAHAQQMQKIVSGIESVAGLLSYQSAVLDYVPEIARFRPGPVGVFMGYDFHLGPNGLELIEINTNAGGALINAYLLQAQRTCCAETAQTALTHFDLPMLLDRLMSSLESEWRRQGRTSQLQSIAIVDHAPREQYLYPEFVLFQRLFEKRGMGAIIASPSELTHRDGHLWHEERRIDLVYNRLTDFQLEQPENLALRSAYFAGDVVVTPNPWTHAIYANKSNLVLLSDGDLLRTWGVSDDLVRVL